MRTRMHRAPRRIIAGSSSAVLIAPLQLAPGAPTVRASTFVVTSTGDGGDVNPGNGVCDDGAGGCTLRAAITETDFAAGADTIHFAVPGAGPHTILVQTTSATQTHRANGPVVIDGYSQPGASPNTRPITEGSDALHMIHVDGAGTALGTGGLVLAGGNSVVRGIVLENFPGNGLIMTGGGGNTIEGNVVQGIAGFAVQVLDNSNNLIGGTSPAARNVISGNGVGVHFFQPTARDNRVQGNFIGVDATGLSAMGNTQVGVRIDSGSDNLVGGTSDAERNIISANTSFGLSIASGSGNVIQGNYIGTGIAGAADLGNGSAGVLIGSGSDNTVGGIAAGAGNRVAFNALAGVAVNSGTGNRVLSNSTYENDGLGIDLVPYGLTANDAGDPDSGPNRFQNFPIVSTASISGGDVVVEYSVDSDPSNSAYPLTVQFFSSEGGEGRTLLGSDSYTSGDFTAGAKSVNLGNAVGLGVQDGDSLVATATDADGNTSEFTFDPPSVVTPVPAAGAGLMVVLAALLLGAGGSAIRAASRRRGARRAKG